MSKMNPKERMISAVKGQRPDKLPMMAIASNSFICNQYQLSITDYLEDTKACAQATIEFIEEYEFDSCVVATGYIFYGCGPELNVEWNFPDGEFPACVRGALANKEDLSHIRVPKEPTGYFKNYLEVVSKVSYVLGRTHHLVANILGPFSTTCFLRGIENALLDTVEDKLFFNKCMSISADLSTYFGQHVLSTGVPFTALNEIFLTPEMISPSAYHEMIAPWDNIVQEKLHPNIVPNTMGAFMGSRNKPESYKEGKALYNAFFGINNSVEDIKKASKYSLPGIPFPLSISGYMLDAFEADQIVEFLDHAVNFLVRKHGLYPVLTLVSVQAGSQTKANEISSKIESIRSFRDSLSLP